MMLKNLLVAVSPDLPAPPVPLVEYQSLQLLVPSVTTVFGLPSLAVPIHTSSYENWRRPSAERLGGTSNKLVVKNSLALCVIRIPSVRIQGNPVVLNLHAAAEFVGVSNAKYTPPVSPAAFASLWQSASAE
jgi:hypothetical protein